MGGRYVFATGMTALIMVTVLNRVDNKPHNTVTSTEKQDKLVP